METFIKTRIIRPTSVGLKSCAEQLQKGNPVAIPTETVYGLAAPAFDPEALARVFEIKERPTFDPLILHVNSDTPSKSVAGLAQAGIVDASQLSPLAVTTAESLMREFWPGPFTLVLPKHARVPDLATSGLPTVAVRMPRHPVAQELLRVFGMPLAAPSANRFGRISPTTAQAVYEELRGRIELILDGGPCEVGLESTILSLDGAANVRLLRPGGISREEIESVLGFKLQETMASGASAVPVAPGMLESHYSPRTPFRVLPAPILQLPDDKIGPVPKSVALLLMSGEPGDAEIRFRGLGAERVQAVSLSASGDLREIAKGLFAAMRALDETRADLILSEPAPSSAGLGLAISDRLGRAAADTVRETRKS